MKGGSSLNAEPSSSSSAMTSLPVDATPFVCACFVLSQELLHFLHLWMEFNLTVFMYPQDCLQAPSVNVHTKGGGGVVIMQMLFAAYYL